MDKIGRNEPCPCGSGQKYKKCCMAKDEVYESRRRDEERAVQTALSWLEQNYPEEVGTAVHFDFMDEPDEDRMDAIDALSSQLDQAISVNIGEWLLEIEHEKDDPALVRYITTSTIIDYWLDSILETKQLPSLVDASTGEKIDLTTDHYRVTNWKELERILDVQNDVEGARHDGWNRFVELEDGRCRSLASLMPKEPDTLEVFCRTLKLADEARAWLEDIAGGVIAYKVREVVDPRSENSTGHRETLPEPDIPKECRRQSVHQLPSPPKHYETWPEIPLPALEGKSPLQAVKIKRLRLGGR